MAKPRSAPSVQDDMENADAKALDCAQPFCFEAAHRAQSKDCGGMSIQRLQCNKGHRFTRIWPI